MRGGAKTGLDFVFFRIAKSEKINNYYQDSVLTTTEKP